MNIRALSVIQWVYEFFSMILAVLARLFLKFPPSQCKTIELSINALAKMDKLLLLQLNHVKLKGSYKNLPQGLKWLCMHGFLLKYIPSDLPMESLVVLDMSYSDLEQLWKKPRLLGSLKILNLSYCRKLIRVGGFSGLPSLERLTLEGCVSLNHVCESIGHECAKLVLLNMSYCGNLKKLPQSIGKLKKVRILSVSSCVGIVGLPIEMQDMESLKVLNADRIPKLVLHSLPQSLVTLSITGNNLTNESFPVDLSSLSMLKQLFLDKNPIDSLPTFVRSLGKLQILSVERCPMLKSVLCLPRTQLLMIMYSGSESLNEITEIFKIHDLAKVDEKILSRLGWTNLQFVKNQKLKFRLPHFLREKKVPVQMFYENGIFSTCFVGKEVPNWSGGYISSNGSSISFTMPFTPVNKRFQGFNIASVHAFNDKCKGGSNMTTKIVNKTKNITWKYDGPLSINRADNDSKMVVRLSHWMFDNNIEFADGDEVGVYINENNYTGPVVKTCAIFPVYGDISDMNHEEEDPLAYFKSWKCRIGQDTYPYRIQFAPGIYYLSNYYDFAIFLVGKKCWNFM